MVSRSDIVLGQPNTNPTGSMPLGNGSLGVAAWAANGFTAQLNRQTPCPAPVAITAPAAGATVTATPTVSGTSEPDGTVTVSADGTQLCTATASDIGAWSCAAATGLADGAYT